MKQTLIKHLTFILCVSFLFTACKKNSDAKDTVSTDVQIGTHSDDESMVSEEIDAIADDANTLMESDPALSGNNSVVDEIICDASVAINMESDPMTMTVTFNGANCGIKRSRTGVVVFSMAKGMEWKNEGAVIDVHFQDLKITRKSDGKSITFNGSETYTNVSGGLVFQVASLGSVIHRISSNDLSVKFEDGTSRSWNVARQKAFTYNDGLVITVTGTHTEGNEHNIAEWGTNRFGNTFVTLISEPIVVKQNCDFRVTGGTLTSSTEVYTATATFGLDVAGNATTCPGAGHYYYKLGWTRNNTGNNFSIILPY
jgi:hypothetical protein